MKRSHSFYCKEHKCKLHYCKNKRTGEDYCDGHLCGYKKCNKFAFSTEKKKKYCKDHKCKMINCENYSIINSVCLNHKCKICTNTVCSVDNNSLKKYKTFCNICINRSICQYKHCVIFKDGSSFCCDHKCKNNNCSNINLNEGLYCNKCTKIKETENNNNNNDNNNNNSCAVCFEDFIDSKRGCFIPCGHAQFCIKCSEICKEKCPICNTLRKDYIKIYVN